jgi:molecular chaperone GrpE
MAQPGAGGSSADGADMASTDMSQEPSSRADDTQPEYQGGARVPVEPDAEAIRRLEGQLEDERDRHLRLAAEYDNYRKRSLKERQDAGARAQGDLVRQLIEALDDVARFAHVDPASTDAATVVQGVDMVEKKLLKALGSAGLEVINPVGETFDPALHEAVATEPTSAREDDHVVSRVYQPGYVFKSQLLRPARVVVKQYQG